MNNYNDLILFQKAYDLALWMHPVLNKFPKSEKFILAQKIEDCSLQMLEDIVKVNSEIKNQYMMEKLNTEVDKLRILFRLAKDLRFVSIKSYGVFAEKITEIGKMIGGLEKARLR